MSLELGPVLGCDRCGTQENMFATSYISHSEVAWTIPVGWITIKQGLGYHSGVGTSPLPGEIDVYLNGKVYCSTPCLVEDVTEALIETLKESGLEA